MNIMGLMKEFHAKLDPVTGLMDEDRYRLREDLMVEETREYMRASRHRDLLGIADALGDIVYVAFGTAYSMGFDLNAVIAEIHRSNMTKEKGPTGKAVKGPNYSPPDLLSIVGKKVE